MEMNVFIVLIILPVVTNYGSTETSKELPKDIRQKTTIKPLLKDVATSADPTSNSPKDHSMWLYPPVYQAMQTDDFRIHQVISRTPRSLTKLAKTFYSGFNPSFSKDYFEPFERRSKPITLISFRRNGIEQRSSVKVSNINSAEVAELQSPYNDVSSYWREEPEEMLKMA